MADKGTPAPYMTWVKRTASRPVREWRRCIAQRLRFLGYKRYSKRGVDLFLVMLDDVDTYRVQGYLTKLPASMFH